jgi:hypothetical protein
MSEFLREAARLQPSLVSSLQTLHRRAEAAIQEAVIADTLLDARELGPAAASTPAHDGARTEPSAHDLSSSVAASPLRSLQALDAYSVKPLLELELLGLRAAQLLRRRHAAERRLSAVISGVVGVFIGLGLYLLFASAHRASALVLLLGAALAFALVRWKWRPYRRAARTLHLLALADSMAEELRGKLQTLDALPDHPTRHLQQWQHVLALTDPLRDLWRGR